MWDNLCCISLSFLPFSIPLYTIVFFLHILCPFPFLHVTSPSLHLSFASSSCITPLTFPLPLFSPPSLHLSVYLYAFHFLHLHFFFTSNKATLPPPFLPLKLLSDVVIYSGHTLQELEIFHAWFVIDMVPTHQPSSIFPTCTHKRHQH